MQLTLNSIIYKLKEYKPCVLANPQGLSREFKGVRQYYKSGPALGVDQIYVTRATVLHGLGQRVDSRLTYLCVNDCGMKKADLKVLSPNLILISGKYPMEQILNRVLEIFEEFKAWDKNMHIATLEGATPQEMIELSRKVICLPMIIFDASFNVMAFTKHIPTDYTFFNATVANGYTPSEIIMHLKRERIFELLNQQEGMVVHTAAGTEKRSNVYIRMQSENTLLGYGCVFVPGRTVDQGYIDIMRGFFENLKLYYMQNYKSIQYGSFMYENFLSTLIQNPSIPKEQLLQQLEYMEGIRMEGPYVLVLFHFLMLEEVPLTFLAREVKQVFFDGYPFLFQGNLYLLLKRANRTPRQSLFLESEIERLGHLLSAYGYQCCISRTFHHINQLSLANDQCERTRALAREKEFSGGGLFFFEDEIWNHMLHIWKEQLPAELLMAEEYLILKDYCRENKNNYEKILYTYLKNRNHATMTGKKLFMHRNTILYTIKNIEELLGVDFDDFKTSQAFLRSFLADGYIEE